MVDADNYLLLCQRYIELNPVRTGMVESPGEYHWSSYRANGLGRPAVLWTPHPAYLSLGTTSAERAGAYRRLFRGPIDVGELTRIRTSTNQGMALGNERFVLEVGSLSGRRVVTLKRGPKGGGVSFSSPRATVRESVGAACLERVRHFRRTMRSVVLLWAMFHPGGGARLWTMIWIACHGKSCLPK